MIDLSTVKELCAGSTDNHHVVLNGFFVRFPNRKLMIFWNWSMSAAGKGR